MVSAVGYHLLTKHSWPAGSNGEVHNKAFFQKTGGKITAFKTVFTKSRGPLSKGNNSTFSSDQITFISRLTATRLNSQVVLFVSVQRYVVWDM